MPTGLVLPQATQAVIEQFRQVELPTVAAKICIYKRYSCGSKQQSLPENDAVYSQIFYSAEINSKKGLDRYPKPLQQPKVCNLYTVVAHEKGKTVDKGARHLA